LAFPLIVSARRLRPYFQAHAIRVLPEYPLKKILQKPDLSGRLVNWPVELGQFNIEFHPRTSINGQVLANFLLKFSSIPESEELPKKDTWVAYVDGSSANQKSGVGVTLASPDGESFQYAIKLDFVTTNNEAEYEAVLAGLSIAQEMGAKNVELRSDFQVVVSHVQRIAEAQGEKMIQYLNKVREYQSNFSRMAMTKIPRKENVEVDALSKMGSGTGPDVKTSTNEVAVQTEPAINPKLEMMEVEERSTNPEWATDVVQYLHHGSLPEEKLLSRKVKMHSARYVLIGGILYRRGYIEPLLKCLTNSESECVLKEIHEGICGNHSGSRMLAHKATRAGYYWPTMNKDLVRLVQHCDKCQRFAWVMRNPPEKLSPITSPWPFAKWGVDIVGPMPPGKGKRRFLLVVVDYFTKWAEAEAFATITADNVIKFLWSSVICRFGIPHAFVTDNGK
jgi:ribonuclease HI